MKLLVFAHTPPPHHGQSYMVKLMLDGLGGDHRQRGAPSDTEAAKFGVECYHVNARLSAHLEDIGSMRLGKMALLLVYCMEAIWCRFRYGVTTLYYVPAPGKRSALVRDWLVMALCRPFFKRIILHWHAAGLGRWLEVSTNNFHRHMTYRALGRADLCMVLSRFNRSDAEKLWPNRIRVVGNGIPDPCPDFEQSLLPRRRARFVARQKLLSGQNPTPAERDAAGTGAEVIRVLYLAHCTREKGLFDTIEAVRRAAATLAEQQSPVRLHLTVAGAFVDPAERETLLGIWQDAGMKELMAYAGFVGGQDKSDLLHDADLFCFPTFYPNENQPVNLIEAMAWGLPIVTTRWRSVPELLPPDYNGLATPQSVEEVSAAILRVASTENGERMRERFVETGRLDRHLANLAAAIRSVETEPENSHAPAPALGRLH